MLKEEVRSKHCPVEQKQHESTKMTSGDYWVGVPFQDDPKVVLFQR